MSLEFFRKKRFQRRHPDVFCQRMALTIPCVSSLRVTPHQVLKSFHCSLQRRPAWHVPGERISLSNPLALPVVKGSQRLCRRRQASRPSPDPEPTRMSNNSPSTRVQHSQSVRRHHNFCCCVRFCHCCRFSFHGPRQDISRSRMHTHDEVLLYVVPKIRTHSPCSSTVEAFPNLSYPPRSDWVRAGFAAANTAVPHCLRKRLWQNLTRLCC